MGCLGAPSWGHFRPFGRPSSAKLRPKRVLEGYQRQKRKFSRNTTPADTAAIFGAPRWPPKCSKVGSRRLPLDVEKASLMSLLFLCLCHVLRACFGSTFFAFLALENHRRLPLPSGSRGQKSQVLVMKNVQNRRRLPPPSGWQVRCWVREADVLLSLIHI